MWLWFVEGDVVVRPAVGAMGVWAFETLRRGVALSRMNALKAAVRASASGVMMMANGFLASERCAGSDGPGLWALVHLWLCGI